MRRSGPQACSSSAQSSFDANMNPCPRSCAAAPCHPLFPSTSHFASLLLPTLLHTQFYFNALLQLKDEMHQLGERLAPPGTARGGAAT